MSLDGNMYWKKELSSLYEIQYDLVDLSFIFLHLDSCSGTIDYRVTDFKNRFINNILLIITIGTKL